MKRWLRTALLSYIFFKLSIFQRHHAQKKVFPLQAQHRRRLAELGAGRSASREATALPVVTGEVVAGPTRS